MNFTGERPTIGHEIESSQWRYKSILPFCKDKSILEIGCGIGHGTYLLAQHTKRFVRGYDPCQEAIDEAKSTFGQSNLGFTNGDYLKEYIKDCDIVVMVESIEHFLHDEAISLIDSIRTRGKELVITTPNGDVFPYHPKSQEEFRGFHKWHYKYEELKQVLSIFPLTEIYGSVYDTKIDKFTSLVAFARY
jgi:2-polyprenyl-3-methyl-5-hydroxy-6-metoxy-1,4-benzoquinol methylase